MEIRDSAVDGGHRFALSGRLDAYQVPALQARLDAADGDIVLDLAEVVFIDSTGLATLVNLHRRTESEGRTLRIVEVPDRVRGIFEITQLHTVLPLELP